MPGALSRSVLATACVCAAPSNDEPISRPRTPAALASRPMRAASAVEVRTGSTRTSKPEPLRPMKRSLLGLGFERVGDEGICGQQVERELPSPARPRGDASEQRATDLFQMGGESEWGIVHGAVQALAQRGRWRGTPRVEPGQHLVPGHRAGGGANSRTISGVRARASPSLDGSPTPADAKWGRPPPFPPVAAAMALAMSPALMPLETRSSVTATWIPARLPVVNNTEIA